ncbi:tRNA-dihydrouridine(16/17) synthase [NAD(P)(+)]-like protein [Thoreauomyces humboldtii]|nr:tRNA-dihydrouridine(16/17) synthase [NAD(P)(+)]-like protein [Thoreauomyces humboldtii]
MSSPPFAPAAVDLPTVPSPAAPPPLAPATSPDQTPVPNRKLKGFEFYRQTLKSPKNIVAPMVDQSEYAWRILSNRYGADLCYTPMLHARLFSQPDGKYKRENWQTGDHDRPLIAQFCANEPDVLLAAARLVENECDAVDINLGCPQHIAKRGRYGSYLQDEWDLIERMVRILDEKLAVPVTVKIRVFPDVEKTIRYARMIEAAGAQLLTVHGRVRDQKGHKTGLADWEQIKRVKESVSIPVFANGNILYQEDIDRCMARTGVDGVMTAEGNLYNPGLFTGKHYASWKLAEEFLQICTEYPESSNVSAIRGHLFKMFKPCLSIHTDVRTDLAKANTLDDMKALVAQLKARLVADSNGAEVYTPPPEGYELDDDGLRVLPNWCLQPYVRIDGTLPKPTSETLDAPATPPAELTEDEKVLDGGSSEGKAPAPTQKDVVNALADAKVVGVKRMAPGDTLAEHKAKGIGDAKRRKAGKHPACTADTCLNNGSPKCIEKRCKKCCRAQPDAISRQCAVHRTKVQQDEISAAEKNAQVEVIPAVDDVATHADTKVVDATTAGLIPHS